MRFVKKSTRTAPLISLILLDWSVRESFHLLDFLRRQTMPRELFEVVVVEYYDHVSPSLAPYTDMVDTWLLLEMPRACLYHKHVMYNAGIAVACGPLIMIGDSDAMVRETFVQSLLESFDRNPCQVLHLDQFRNHRRDFYPFNWPSFEAVLGDGCVNNCGGKTVGLVDTQDPLHTRNYGACMCALRADLIAVGGADEHIDFLGHICGPYDMTFRLLNKGLREVWHESEFTYHTWHPGQAGEDNYQGPHDGRQMSTTALDALVSGRVLPLVENAAIASLRHGEVHDEEALLAKLIDPVALTRWKRGRIVGSSQKSRFQIAGPAERFHYKGYRIERVANEWRARPLLANRHSKPALVKRSAADLMAMIDQRVPLRLKFLCALGWTYVFLERIWERFVRDRSRNRRAILH